MTNLGFQDIFDRIVNRTINYPTPHTMTVRDMQNWLNGYAKCQFDILNIIKDMMDGESE